MTQERNRRDERIFTIELRSKSDVMSVAVGRDEQVLVEGSIGSLMRARFLEDLILEVIGSKGEIRIDLAMEDLERLVKSEAANIEVEK